mgnify:CR=1 FL=1
MKKIKSVILIYEDDSREYIILKQQKKLRVIDWPSFFYRLFNVRRKK